MMSSKFLLFVIVLLSYVFVACGSHADSEPQDAVIYFYGFEVERITGIHEEEIEELGCAFSAESKAIASALKAVESGNSDYDRRDVRAKIEMLGRSYFVDRTGAVRQGDNYFELDKVQFVASLTQVGTCE